MKSAAPFLSPPGLEASFGALDPRVRVLPALRAHAGLV